MNSIDKSWVDTHINSNGEVVIPEGVQIIAAKAFYENDKVKRVIMPDSVLKIGIKAFASCPNLQEVKISNNLEVLAMNAFRNCSQLKEITIPDKVKTIYPSTFLENSNLESITLNGNLDYLSSMSFNKCEKIKEININGTEKINYNAFLQKSSVKKITIDGQDITIKDQEQLFSIQKAGKIVSIVTQRIDNKKFLTRCINLEKNISKTIESNAYLTDTGKFCYAINSLSDVSLQFLENLKKSGRTQLYIYGGDNEITPSQNDANLNFNLYNIDDLIQIKTKILELKKRIQIPDKQDKHREKKIYSQLVQALSKDIDYDYWGAKYSREEYEKLTGNSYDDYIEKNQGRNSTTVRLESRNLLGLLRGTAVCQGYAEIIRNSASEYGIQVELIRGSAPNGESHAWNQVKLDGFWYDDDFTNYQTHLANDNLDKCQYFLIGSVNGIPLTEAVGYKTNKKQNPVSKNLSKADKKSLLNYGRETMWLNRLKSCDKTVDKSPEGAKKKQELVKLFQDLEHEKNKDKIQQKQKEAQNPEQR